MAYFETGQGAINTKFVVFVGPSQKLMAPKFYGYTIHVSGLGHAINMNFDTEGESIASRMELLGLIDEGASDPR